MKPPEEGGSRLAIVFNGSPLFTGGAGLGRVRDPPLDHRERLAGGRRCPARSALLQHRHLHLLLDRHQPQVARAAGQGPARRRPRLLREDAQVARREAQGDLRGADRGDHRLYGEFEESEKVKIFPNEAFGFLRITVERPLRLRWEVTDETIARSSRPGRSRSLLDEVQAGTAGAARRSTRCASSRTRKRLAKALTGASARLESASGAAQKAIWPRWPSATRGSRHH